MNILGLMSGSSLDGLDMAICSFSGIPGNTDFQYEIKATRLVEFPEWLIDQLSHAHELDSKSLLALHAKFGLFMGENASTFLKDSHMDVQYIASHGHTVFHFPEQGFTFQLGSGADLAFLSKKDTICDFRSSDIAAKGSGAPFAPIIDRYMFNDIDILVNLGGISNFSFKFQDDIIAFDISPCNQLLNYVAQKSGKLFDEDGKIAAQGTLIEELFNELINANELKGFGPRALDNSWVKSRFYPLINQYSNQEDIMRTIAEFIVYELFKAIKWLPISEHHHTMAFTGGGGLNKFLMSLIKKEADHNNLTFVEIPETMINFKEACLIALLGYLRVNEIGIGIESVTGALQNSIGGCIYKAM